MANMQLGAYIFDVNPSDMTRIVTARKTCAAVPTYGGVAYFTWGTLVAGEEIELSWDYMTSSQYESLDDLYRADEPVVWSLNDGGSPPASYNVEIMELTGRYFLGIDGDWLRRDVKMTLLILSEAS